MRGRIHNLLVVPVLAGVLLAGCAGTDERADQQQGNQQQPEKRQGKSEAEVVTVDSIDIRGAKGTKPRLDGFDGPVKFDETATEVLDEGDGPAVEEGQSVQVDYIGFNARDGKSFDDSWERGQPVTFSLKKGAMIDGFVEGLKGQKVGSRVVVAIPSKDGYPDGNGGAIRKGDSLIFVVELKQAWTPLATASGKEADPPADLPAVEVNEKNEVTGIEKPKGDPPTRLIAEPLIEGEGDRVGETSTVELHWYGIDWKSGKKFQSTREGAGSQPIPLAELGAQAPGLSEGLVGRRVGDRMLLVLPPEAGFGQAAGQMGLSEDATTVWAIDILGAS